MMRDDGGRGPAGGGEPIDLGRGPRSHDPRDIVTPDAFTVAPELLGRPLARPWKRGAALAVDGLLVAIVSNLGIVLLPFAAAVIVFRMTAVEAKRGFLRRTGRLAARFTVAVLVFGTLLALGDGVRDWVSDRADAADGAVTAGDEMARGGGVTISGVERITTVLDIVRLMRAGSAAEAERTAAALTHRFAAAGMTPDEVDNVLEDALVSIDARTADSVRALVRGQLAAASGERVATTMDSGENSGSTAGPSGDPAEDAGLARVDRDGSSAVATAESDSTEILADRVAALERANDELRSRLDERREQDDGASEGFAYLVGIVADEIGLGMGWAGLYFTAFLALWGGQTPGKRLFRIRVLRLTGRPVGWWAAFERFGGYAAGVATGLFGFFQIFWDRNRQAVHDKIVETVVVQE